MSDQWTATAGAGGPRLVEEAGRRGPAGKGAMDDTDILSSIQKLVDEEHEIEGKGDGLDEEEAERLRQLEERLDQCWDLLRQRRARRSAGLDPDQAEPRSTDTVEHYLQ
jgi:hypothetical protein